MNAVLPNLLKLQALDFGRERDEAEATRLRSTIPQPILAHYDRLVARGKKGVALIRNQACTGCYMKQPIGKITTLMRGQDIQLCDTCGRYLYLPSEAESRFVEHVAAAKPPPKAPRKKKTPAPVVATA